MTVPRLRNCDRRREIPLHLYVLPASAVVGPVQVVQLLNEISSRLPDLEASIQQLGEARSWLAARETQVQTEVEQQYLRALQQLQQRRDQLLQDLKNGMEVCVWLCAKGHGPGRAERWRWAPRLIPRLPWTHFLEAERDGMSVLTEGLSLQMGLIGWSIW